MADNRPYTDAELEAGARAVGKLRHFIDTDGYRSIRVGTAEDEARVVLEAVLPLHAARIRQETAEEIAQAINRTDDEPSGRSYSHGRVDAARIARSHATTPTEGGQDAQPVE